MRQSTCLIFNEYRCYSFLYTCTSCHHIHYLTKPYKIQNSIYKVDNISVSIYYSVHIAGKIYGIIFYKFIYIYNSRQLIVVVCQTRIFSYASRLYFVRAAPQGYIMFCVEVGHSPYHTHTTRKGVGKNRISMLYTYTYYVI